MARELRKQEVYDAVKAYAVKNGKTTMLNDAGNIIILPGDIIVSCENGKLECSDADTKFALSEILMEMPQESKAGRSQENKAIVPSNGRKSQGEALVKPRAINTLSRDEIRKFTKCQDATDDEVDYFVEVCWRRGLNIFAGDAYLVKYGGKNPAASIIVSKEAFMKKAEQNPNFDGMDSGIILQIGDEIKEIDGTFYMGNKAQIVGAWAKVYRKDRSHPSVAKVAFSEFKGQSHFWEGKPAIMINKVAEMTALRKAFPSDLGALYGAEECNVDLGMDPEREVKA
jgi:phage recombination protein Bet